MNENTKAKQDFEVLSLASKIASLVDDLRGGYTNSAEFNRWLMDYSTQCNRILHPIEAPQPINDIQRETIEREDRVFLVGTLCIQWMEKQKIVLPPGRWEWVLRGKHGSFNGIPNSNGVARISNGILLVVENEVGNIFMGHRDWFIPDEDPEQDASQTAKTKQPRKKVVLPEFEGLFE